MTTVQSWQEEQTEIKMSGKASISRRAGGHSLLGGMAWPTLDLWGSSV